MFRRFLYAAILLVALFVAPAYAAPAKIVKQSKQLQIPCLIPGDPLARACVVMDVTIEAAAPVNDVVFDKSPAKVLYKKQPNLAIIYRFHISDNYRNDAGSVFLWSPMNRFLAKYPVNVKRDITIYAISSDGGVTWSGPRTRNREVSFDVRS